MPRVSAATKSARTAHMEAHPSCWMCRFLGQKQAGKSELHHIAGRGRRHERRENYSTLCAGHHAAVQSRWDGEVVCLTLKRLYDLDFYSTAVICSLRGRADTWITEADVTRAAHVMYMMRMC